MTVKVALVPSDAVESPVMVTVGSESSLVMVYVAVPLEEAILTPVGGLFSSSTTVSCSSLSLSP